MNYQNVVTRYLRKFRRDLKPYIKKGININFLVYPTADSGAIIEVTLGPTVKNTIYFRKPYETTGIALKDIKQSAFSGELQNIKFAGTNILSEPDRIVLIKGSYSDIEWNSTKVTEDISRILHSGKEVHNEN